MLQLHFAQNAVLFRLLGLFRGGFTLEKEFLRQLF
jgi:hypothetical protein